MIFRTYLGAVSYLGGRPLLLGAMVVFESTAGLIRFARALCGLDDSYGHPEAYS